MDNLDAYCLNFYIQKAEEYKDNTTQFDFWIKALKDQIKFLENRAALDEAAQNRGKAETL